ncbi:MAG TPA: alanine--tRNA ligase [Terracidiphilus sp.]
MQVRTGNEIRELFLRFFESKGHRRVASSSLVPHNDPTLLFANAGMNQFKDLFLGAEKRDYSRATTSQKCVRAGGKHNDLENVGFTRRHHTFFEMLGNFSFGDYFKRDAIKFAWELVTSEEWFGIRKDRLYVTIFEGTGDVPRDKEAEQFWLETGVPKDRIFEYGLKDNFWQMGETGPCGPCSEIFYDMGIEAAETPGVDLPFGKDDARYVEIWNLVFMQFDRAAVVDPETKSTTFSLTPLPKPSIDTGMGLERVAAVLQGKVSNFETDLFTPLITRAADLVGVLTHSRARVASGGPSDPLPEPATQEQKTKAAYGLLEKNIGNASLRIIADHSRAATFLINDGVLPSNEGRGYVLRKILRRAIFHGRKLDKLDPFLYQMVFEVSDMFGKPNPDGSSAPYPELMQSADRVAKVVEAEERQFNRVLLSGSTMLQALINRTEPEEDGRTVLRGSDAFHLYETYGLPKDFIQDACHDSGIAFDDAGFEAARAEEQSRARASWRGGAQKTASPAFRDLPKTIFEGYKQLTSTNCEVLAIVKNGAGVPAAKAGDTVEIVLDHTSFYADAGGQVGDTGFFLSPDGNTTIAEITGCIAPVQGVRAHKAMLKQDLTVGDHLQTVVNGERSDAIRRNHTGTHLLHAALRQVLGTHVKQAGSLVAPDRLRFDFSHFAQVADEELEEIESIVNREVLKNATVETIVDVPIDVAVNEYHAMALFGEKYGDKVRVVKLSDGFSTELCGGTHTSATGEIGLLKLTTETSVSSGVRRIEAISGLGSLDTFRRDFAVAQFAAQIAGTPDGNLSESLRARLTAQEDEMKRLHRELEEMRMKSAAGGLDAALSDAIDVKGIKLLRHRADNLERGQLRTLVDNLKQKVGEGVVILASAQPEGKVAIIAGVTPGLTKRIQAGKLVGAVARFVGGSGGGKPEIAEAGGKDQSQIDAALKAAPEVVASLLS